MSKTRPGRLAVRAVNQYRRRDVLSYLSLRYYLANEAARNDAWAHAVAANLVTTRQDLSYFPALHFKDVHQDTVIHRAMFVPGANEALAEAALIDACASLPREFGIHPQVFSYRPLAGESRVGMFEPYVIGLRERQAFITRSCEETPSGLVQYIDIKQFYPSISTAHARGKWKAACHAAHLDSGQLELGLALIDSYEAVRPRNERGILTGPMFSHVLANLVLRELDEEFSTNLPVRYCRYVDDITLIGDAQLVRNSLMAVRARLEELGFQLHPDDSPKSISVGAASWLISRDDFLDDHSGPTWMQLVADLKRFLLLNPAERISIQRAFGDGGMRIPVQDYSAAAAERTYLSRVRELAQFSWFRLRGRQVTAGSLLSTAVTLRERYERNLYLLIDELRTTRGFHRKRLITRLRYRAGRLAYLSTPDSLRSLTASLRDVPELFFHCEVLNAIATGKLDTIINLGTNAAQAAAQPLRFAGTNCSISGEPKTDAARQALAVFALNGITIRSDHGFANDTELMRFSARGSDPDLMKRGTPFMREIACLHGIAEKPRHAATLQSVFDEDEELAVDAVEQLQQSAS